MGARKKALVIDDDESFGMLMEAMLEDYFEVTRLTDASVAIKTVLAGKPDVILTDVMMPNVSGIEVLRELAADPETRAIPVMVLTGSHFNSSTEELFRQEGNVKGFLSKTMPLTMLLDRVLKFCPAEKGGE